MQDVDDFLRRKGLGLSCYFHPDRAAVIDDGHGARVNYETYFFAETGDRDRFLEDPVRWCGLVTDPVSKRRFRPDGESPRLEHEGVLFLFETRTTRRHFSPADALPGFSM